MATVPVPSVNTPTYQSWAAAVATAVNAARTPTAINGTSVIDFDDRHRGTDRHDHHRRQRDHPGRPVLRPVRRDSDGRPVVRP